VVDTGFQNSNEAGLNPLLMNALEKVRAKLIDISSTYGHEGAKGAISFDAMRNAPCCGASRGTSAVKTLPRCSRLSRKCHQAATRQSKRNPFERMDAK
jgi:hypothetical protein